ncbi:MAG: hypothetical protein R2734_15610 [Nocardioides sp.]
MTNSPMKKTRVSPLDVDQRVLDRDGGDQQQDAGAEQRHHRRLAVRNGVQHEPGEHQCQHEQAPPQQRYVPDGVALGQGHITSATRLGVAVNRWNKDMRGNTTSTAVITTASGPRWTRKWLNVRLARLPMMMLGGSPIRCPCRRCWTPAPRR